jgi:uncharacterized protein
MPTGSAMLTSRCGLLRLALAATLLLFCAGAALAQSQPQFPPLTGRVVDEANLLSAADRAQLTTDLEALEKKSSDQLVVVTLKSLQGYAIEDYAYQLGRTWNIGQQKVENGVLLIVAPNERQVRIEVDSGLQPQLTDALSALIIHNAILPAFRRGDWGGGIKAGVRDITDVLLGDPEAVKQRLASRVKRTPGVEWDSLLTLLFWAVVIGLVIYSNYQQSRRLPPGSGARRRDAYGPRGPIIIPGGWGGSGNWGGGGGGGGGFGGGGGGGGFNGGGASGSW